MRNWVLSKLKSTDRSKFDSNEKYRGNKLRQWKRLKVVLETIPLIDVFKLVLIVGLLSASIVMYRYEPPSSSSSTVTEPMTVPSVEEQKSVPIDENPYGFHPFYQVHGRIEFKNPLKNICDGMDPKRTLLLTILSRASNVHVREAIRQTWGANRFYNQIEVRLIFVVGVDDGMLKQIEIEQNIYHDVIQVNLPENYPIVSYKELASLCWSKYFCPGLRFQFKADEDIHLNTPLLARVVGEFMKNESLPNEPIMYGWFRHKSQVDRSGRYLITEEEYPGFYYPPYTFGIGYMMTKAGRDQLCVSAVKPHPVTRVGDAYITGILRDHSMVNHAKFGDVHYIYSYTLSGKLCKEYFYYDPKLLVCMSSVHSGSNDATDEYVHVWNVVYKEGEDDDEQKKNL